MTYYRRIVDGMLAQMLYYCGAIEIRGPKWCGKSTTAARLAASTIYMQDQNQKAKNILLAHNNPDEFLAGATPRLIDEWQEVAFIWDHIRFTIDKRGLMGQFILTGSATPLDKDAYAHSGIGRIVPLIMRPMSLFESHDSDGSVSLRQLFTGKVCLNHQLSYSLDDYIHVLCRGGWPQALTVAPEYALRLVENFYQGLIHEDINRVYKNKKNAERLAQVMRAYARAVSSQTTLENLTRDIQVQTGTSIDTRTVTSYLEALGKLYIIEELPAWNPNLRSRTSIRTAPTRHFVDPSLAVAALGASPADLRGDMLTLGVLFESLCIRDLRIYAQGLGGNIYHYRDRGGLEADAIIHLPNGDWAGVEVKLRSNQAVDEAAAHLLELSSKIDTTRMKPPKFLLVLTAGDYAYTRPDGVQVVPLACLAP